MAKRHFDTGFVSPLDAWPGDPKGPIVLCVIPKKNSNRVQVYLLQQISNNSQLLLLTLQVPHAPVFATGTWAQAAAQLLEYVALSTPHTGRYMRGQKQPGGSWDAQLASGAVFTAAQSSATHLLM